MEEKERLLINVIKDALNGEVGKTELPSEQVIPLILTARFHNLLNIVYPVVIDRPEVDEKLRLKLKKFYATFVNQQILLNFRNDEIIDLLASNGIKVLPLKGKAIRELYPSPFLRGSCDVDLFYKGDYKVCDTLLKQAGFSFVEQNEQHYEYKGKGLVTVELHYSLCSPEQSFADYYDNDIEKYIKVKENVYKFSDEDHYIYLILHALKHFEISGFGIRTLIDFYVFNKEKKNLDRNYIEKELSSLNLCDFEKGLRELAYFWFEKGAEGEETLLLKNLGSYILKSGVYGNVQHMTINNLNEAKKNKFKYFFKRAFPPLPVMKKIYRGVRKHPKLVFLYYPRRLFSALFCRFGRVKSEWKNINDSTGEQMDNQDRLFTELGLNAKNDKK